ncbi:Small GTPase like protein [Aduncisulcus paluster]|uniref:Small GTPase like protein n=1 Tax=Aduncisulcus paluster TaxID=2918883 RepID=A0ABQ5JWL5_9EUKA|nr:Small GTPase like protein [Aduncisulcus paluster]
MSSEKIFKVLVVGPPYCGKTSIVNFLSFNLFSEEYKTTLGVDFVEFRPRDCLAHKFPDDVAASRIQLWDVGGQEVYRGIVRYYYEGAHCCFVVCDISHPNSFQKAIQWKRDIDEGRTFPGSSSLLPSILFFNKTDLPHDLTDDDLAKIARDGNFTHWFKGSVKTMKETGETGLYDAVTTLIRETISLSIKTEKEAEEAEKSDGEDSFVDFIKSHDKDKEKGCCK